MSVLRATPSQGHDALNGGAPAAVTAHAGALDWTPNLQAIGLFRIAFAVYLLGDFLINDAAWFSDLYTDVGVLPLAALATEAPSRAGLALILPVLRALEGPWLPAALPVLYVASLLAFAIGWRTRWANALAYAINTYLFWRNPQIGSGAEVLAHLLLLWCLFLPLNRHWSVDAALDPAPRDRGWPALPFLAVRFQIAALYLFAALYKLAGEPWRHGDALIQAMSDTVYGGTPAGSFLIEHVPGLLHVATYAVIAFQIAFPFLVYAPWRSDAARALALAGTALMHVSFIVCLSIGGFPYLCLAMLLLLVPDPWLERLWRARRARLAGITIFFQPDCGFCERISLLLRELLLTPGARVLPASADPAALRLLTETQSWVVRDPDGGDHLKWRALAYLLKQSVWLAPLGWLSDRRPLRGPLDRLYDAIGANRARVGPLARALLPFRSDRAPGRIALTLCGALLLLALASNVDGIVWQSAETVSPFDDIAATLQVRQRWSLFAPRPTHWAWTYGLVARQADGTTRDLLADGRMPLRHASPDGPIAFASHRWVKYFTDIDKLTDDERAALGAYVCRRADAAAQVELSIAKQLLEPGPAPETLLRYRFDCTRSGAPIA